MRSFKKVMALVLAVALTLSTFTVSFAAASEAGKLVDLGLLLKTDDLDNTLTRKVGIAVVLKALGYTQEDQDATELANPFTDTEAWYGGFAAIAVDLGITNGVSETEFGGDLVLTQKMFVTWMLRALGYEVSAETYADDAALTALAVEAGLAEEVVDGEFTKGDAVEIMFAALSAEMQDGSGMTLIEVLVAAGEVTREAAVEAGLIDATPEELLVTSVEALNLKQIQVNFNKAVDDAGDEANYDDNDADLILDDSDFDLSDDEMSVVITLEEAAANQDVIDLTIDDIEAVDGDTLEEVTVEDIEFLDTTLPTVLSAEVVGIDTIKVTFSEPMSTTSIEDTDNYEVEDGDIYVKSASAQANDTEVLVELYSDLEEGEISITVSDVEDYAGFEALSKTFTIDVVEDTTAPTVIGYEDADLNSVTLIWSEDIEEDEFEDGDVYHTNTSNPAETIEIDGDEMTITFDEDDEMPNGTAYIYVLADAYMDLWENANSKQVVKIEAVADETAPEFVSYDVTDQDTVVFTFSEELHEDAAADVDVTLFEDGDESDIDVDDVTLTADDDGDYTELTVDFDDELYGDFSIVFEGLQDIAENEADDITVDFTVEDETAPVAADFEAVLYNANSDDQVIKVTFDEAMATEGKYAVTDLEKWVINGENLEDYDATITVVDDGEAVEIEMTNDEDEDGFTFETGVNEIELARVADAAGNYTSALRNLIDIDAAGTVGIDTVEATDLDVIAITFDDYLSTFDKDDFTFTTSGATLAISKVKTSTDSDGNTVATFTLTTEMAYNATYGNGAVSVTVKANADSENKYGEIVLAGATVVADAIVPALQEIEDADGDDVAYIEATSTTTIVLYFEEDLKGTSLSTSTFEVGGGDYEVTAISENNGVVTLTVENDDADDLVGVSVVQQAKFQDAAGNSVSGISEEVAELE